MKNFRKLPSKFLFLALMFYGLFAFSQTNDQEQKITASYNKAYLQDLATQYLNKSTIKKQDAVEYARARNIPISYTTNDGSYAELQKVLSDGTLIYYQTTNKDAAHSTRTDHLNTGGSTGYNLDGQNMNAYVWDGGHPRISHQEYDGPGGINRVSVIDGPQEGGVQLNFHAAHVVGTISASGVQAQAKGMAPESYVKAYKWNDDVSEATTAALNGMLVSNHSYGYRATSIPDQWFGAYQEDSRDWDNVMFNAPYYLMVNSAGNDGEDNTSNGSPFAFGYDKLNFASTAKNNLVIAAANDALVDSDGNLTSVSIASFSSQGPTDDLRIKPDIAGNGVNLYSTFETSDVAYFSISGTSMSSPNVTGSLLLLQQHYFNVNGNYMRAASLKGLALHTADDAGPIGPDAVWGWGLLNAKKAAETITQNGASSMLQELTISQGETITLTVESDAINDLMASISWTDQAGAINGGLNSTTAALVNDLDVRITKDTSTNYPWRLTAYNANAQDGDNSKDPYERVEVENASGIYTITITHKGTLSGGSQAFSLIVTGVNAGCVTASVPQNVEVNGVTGLTAMATWDAVSGALYDLRYRNTESSTWIEVSDLATNSYMFTDLEPSTTYELQVRSKCTGGSTSAYSDLIEFSTSTLTYCDSGSTSADPNFYISNLTLNTINNTSTESTYSDFTALSTELTEGQTYTISITTTANDNPTTSYSVWIDYNRNESFEDAGEQVFTITTTANNIATGNFTVPMEISPLSTTLRVSMTNDTTPAGSCDSFDSGEVEDYTVNISSLQCASPELTLAVQDASGGPIDCLDTGGEYYVLATLSGGEGNTSYNVSANGGDIIEVAADASVVLGPFMVGSDVDVTAVGVQEDFCSVTASIDSPSFCAPVNDDCDGAIALVCGETITGDTANATASGLPITCGIFTSSDAFDIFYTFEADGTSNYVVTLTDVTSFDGVLFVYSGSCGSLTSLGCSDSGNPEVMVLEAPTAGTYTVRLFDYFGTGGFTLGLECISDSECTAPELTLATQDASGGPIDCLEAGGEYYVLATLSGGEGNTSYNVSANGGDVVEVAADGSEVFGPFMLGTDVGVVAIGVQDDVCSVTANIDSPSICPPSNNDCTDAIALSCGDSVTGSTENATDSGMSAPSCTGGSMKDVFYTLDVQEGSEYTVAVNGADYDGVLVLYTGSCGSLIELECADNGFSAGVEETITFTAAATETVVIRTYDWSPSAGSFTLSVSCDSDPVLPTDYFMSTWETTMSNEIITIPTTGSGYNYSVDWGDGNTDSGLTANATHSYAAAGSYIVKINGDFPRIYFNNAGDRMKIKSIEQWGTIEWSSMNSAFMGAENLVSNATDMPDLSMVSDMYGMFAFARAFTGDVNMGNWDVSNVTTMHGMFGGASVFNNPIGNWDVSNVMDMESMFFGATIFNQDLGNWNVSSVTNMTNMFRTAMRFNQDIGNWAVENVTNMNFMFFHANRFNQDLGAWNVSNVTNMTNMFKGIALSTENYDALLNGWSTLTLKNGVRFSGGISQYCAGEAARSTMISTFGWIITDGGKVCSSSARGEALALGDIKFNRIELYPNPMKHQLILGNPQDLKLENISIYDLSGRLVQKENLRGLTSGIEIDVSKLASATYLVLITGEGGQTSRLMIKQ